MKYCSNCGNEIRPGVTVCTHCGHKLNSEVSNNESLGRSDNPKKEKQMKITIISAVLIAVVIILFITIMNHMLSPVNQLDSIKKAVVSEDTSALIENLDNTITVEEADAYIKYINETMGLSNYESEIDDLENSVSGDLAYEYIFDGLYTLLEIEADGKQYLIFDDYNISIPKENVFIYDDYNIEQFTYSISDEKQNWNGTSDKFADLIPGIYNFKGTAQVDGESFNATMNVDFTNMNQAVYNPEYYYINITEDISWSYLGEVTEEDINVSINGEESNINLADYNNITGPFNINEDVTVEASVTIDGNTLRSTPQTINSESNDVETIYHGEYMEPVMSIMLQFNEDEVGTAADNKRDRESKESEREYFEEYMEENAEAFVQDYLYALESMYTFEDINEVEDFINEDSGVYNTLVNNINSGTFEGMFIYNVSVTNFKQEDNIITVTANTERDYNALSEPTSFSTVYTLEYNPETLDFRIVDFRDI